MKIMTLGHQKGIITNMNTYTVDNNDSITILNLGLGRNFESNEDSIIEKQDKTGFITVKEYSIVYSYPD